MSEPVVPAGRRPLEVMGTLAAAVVAVLMVLPTEALAQVRDATVKTDLTELTLEQLADLEVTSVSKKPEKRRATAAAIYVITREDIRRSGATSLPEILRLAPGVEVARIDSDHWAVGVRGFGDQYSRSLLVLIDGRSVYTPLLAGVIWGVQDTLLDDIDRIEVIRGPGGTAWGANAVNGVINIITKAATETHGALASLTGGTVDQGIGEFRFGRSSGKTVDYRVYGKAFSRGPEFHSDGADFDDWRMGQIGFRADWASKTRDEVTLQGDAYKSNQGQSIALASYSPPAQAIVNRAVDFSGGNLRALWQRSLHESDGFQLQAYYDRTYISGPQLIETRNTFDVDFVTHLTLPGRQTFVVGLGARSSPSDFVQTVPTLDLVPHHRNSSLLSAFLQDEIALFHDKLLLTIGSKFEHNSHTGLEIQPNARMAWLVASKQTLWAAVTRAVRTPSEAERGLRFAGLLAPSPPVFGEFNGSNEFDSERVISYEVGYRALATSALYVDVSAFHSEYENLQSFGSVSISLDATPEPPHATIHVPYANGIKGATDGFEVAVDWKPTSRWQLKGFYSYLSLALRNEPGSTDALGRIPIYEGSSPKHQFTIQSRLDLPRGLEFDQIYRYVSALPASQVKAYGTADLRLRWRFAHAFELTVVGKDLLQPRHAELASNPGGVVLIQRGAYANLTWKR